MQEALELPKLRLIRTLFLTKPGLPKKEYLKEVDEIFDELHIELSQDPFKERYQRHVMYAVLSALRKYFRQHHVLFLAVERGDRIYYGFTQDEDTQRNSIERLEGRRNRLIAEAKTERRLLEGTSSSTDLSRKSA